MLRLQTGAGELLPKPRTALLVIPDPKAAPLSSSSAVSTGDSSTETEAYYARVSLWRDAVRTHVAPGVECGLLDEAPEKVLARLETDFSAGGKGRLFEELKRHLSGDGVETPYAAIAARLNMTEGAVKVAVHRIRQRYRELLREEIAHTVANEIAAHQLFFEVQTETGIVFINPRQVVSVHDDGR